MVIANQHRHNLTIRKTYVVMHKCDSVQFLFRQHGSLLRLAENFVARLNGLLLPRGFSASRKKISAVLRILLPRFSSAAIGYGLGV